MSRSHLAFLILALLSACAHDDQARRRKELDALDLRCRASDGEACLKVARAWLKGELQSPSASADAGTRPPPSGSTQYAQEQWADYTERACTLEVREGCESLRDGLHRTLLDPKRWVERHQARLVNVRDTLCVRHASALDCRVLTSYFREGPASVWGDAASINAPKATEYASRSCLLDDDDGCAEEAELIWGGSPADHLRALGLWKRSCTRVGISKHEKTATSCLRAAHVSADGAPGIARDLREATRLFERACGFVPEACVGFREFLRNQCQLESASDCLRLARLHAQGIGGARDNVRAVTFAQKACKLGEKAGCQAAAEWHAP